MKNILLTLTIALTLQTANAMVQPGTPTGDCRSSGCASGYFCGPFFAGHYTCFKDHSKDQTAFSFSSQSFQITGKSCHSIWSIADVAGDAQTDAFVKAERMCGENKVELVSEFKIKEYFSNPGNNCAEATADFTCSDE